MNAFGSKTGFRGFANKLRDQAKDVVGNVKLPSFDEMAMNDEYIHSPDFKVRGAAKTKEEKSDVSTNGGTTIDEASNYSTESSWSLLDRPILVASGTKTIATTTAIPQPTVTEPTIQATIPTTPSTTKPAGSLLSVVSDALQPTTPIQQNRKLAVFNDGYDDDSESSQDFDEEDPILFSMRKDQTSVKKETPTNDSKDIAPASVITIQKSSNRFLDDVRLQTSVEQEEGFDGIIQKAASNNLQTEKGTTPLGGFFKNNSAIQNFQRMVLRKDPHPQQQRRAPPPPLSRERPTKPQNKNDDFQIEASTSVGILGDDEMQRLNQLKLAGESSSAFASFSNIPRMVEYLGERKQSLFVLFTLLLCIFVYFRKSSIVI